MTPEPEAVGEDAPDMAEQLRHGGGDLRRRYLWGRFGRAVTAACLALAAIFLGFLLWDVVQRGWAALDWAFLTSDVDPRAAEAGIWNALLGTIYLMLVTFAFSVPVGVAAAVYLEEFAEDTRLRGALQRLIENLAGVPSIVFGLLGLAIFVRFFGFGTSILAGGLTLGLLVLPIVVVSAEEALAAVPKSFRDGARALGATDWEVVRDHVLPAALPGILTGTILAMSRAIGETAPILFMGSIFIQGAPEGLLDGFLALPLQIFYWTTKPSGSFHELAAAAIIVLLGLLLVMNATAVVIRQWSLNRRNW